MLWVLDLDGVVWLAGEAIAGSADAIHRLHDAGHQVAYVTNNSGPTLHQYVAMLAAVGIEVDAAQLVTSGQAAASLLAPGSRAAVVGGPGVEEALATRGVEVVPAGADPDAVVVGRSVTLDYDSLAAAANAVRWGARFLATNTDATFPTPHGTVPGAGALVAYLEVGSGVKAEVAGKPHGPAADLVRSRFGPAGIVVGDRPDTDGSFAERIGAPFFLVLSGVTSRADLPVHPEPASVSADLAEAVTGWLARPS
jgi:4-nitrophenyl phosphatase